MQIILPDMKNKLINIKPIMSKLNRMLKATGKSFSELEDEIQINYLECILKRNVKTLKKVR